MSGRTTLKSYFLTGATPTEANFADLIDSVLVLSEDLTDSLSTSSSVLALTASAGKTLNDSLTSLTSRVVTLEGADNSFASNYYTKTEVDTQVSGLNSTISALTYSSDIAAVSTRVTALEGQSFAEVLHTHAISDVIGLQDALDTKATTTYVDSIESSINANIAALDLGTDSSAEVASLQSQVSTINTTISGLPTTSDLDAKADTGHTHVVANISDIGTSYYNKSQTDTLLSNVVPKPHTHVEADITNLDKYTTGAVDLKLLDHNSRTDNPHAVTKDQLGLGKVENFNVSEIFQSSEAQLLATKAELAATNSGSTAHTGRTDNPHSVTKAQVGLSNVPDINFQSLLDSHLNASNPHNINLSYFDVYSESETDTRIQFYIDALRYSFKPTSPTDGAGAVGDIAYDNEGLFFKFGPTDWRQILASKKFNDGSPGSTFEIETPKFEITLPVTIEYTGASITYTKDSSDNITAIDITSTNVSSGLATGTYTFVAVGPNTGGSYAPATYIDVGFPEGNVSQNGYLDNISTPGYVLEFNSTSSSAKPNEVLITDLSSFAETSGIIKWGSTGGNLFSVDNTTNTTNINTAVVSIGGATNISNILNVAGDVSLGNSLNVSNLFQVDKTTNTTNISTANVSIGGATNIDNTLNVTGAVSLGGSTFNVTGNTTNIASTHVSLGGNTLNVNGQVSLGSGLTTQGAVSINNTLNVSSHSILSTLRATTATVDSLDSGSGTIQTTGQLKGGATTVTSLSAGSGSISTTGTLSTGSATVTSLSAGSGAISTTGTLSTGGATVTSLSAGSGAISTTGTLSTGGATVTSLDAGSGAISTTGTLSTGGATVTSLDAGAGLIKTTGNFQGADLTLSGNLTVNGTTTTIDTTNLVIEDNMVVLNKNQTGTPATTLDSGIEVERGTATNASVYWDESTDKWKCNLGGTVKTIAFVEDLYAHG